MAIDFLDVSLESGNYTLSILQPRRTNITCVQYGFFIDIVAVDRTAVGVTCGNEKACT